MLWFNKSRRAQTNEDYETWVEGGVVPTMNAFDNGDTRATTIIFYANRVADIRLQDDKINTLQARMGTGGNNMPMVATTQVRRLTPLECERLQGFPDGWTEDQSDTHRYKQMGNAVAVPVVEWIIQGITDTIKPLDQPFIWSS
jgi:site-specific DNA-cytosine methylase